MRYRSPAPLQECEAELYVDPRTGILRRNKFYKRYGQRRRDEDAAATRERAHRMRELGPLLQAHFLKDQWWEVTLAELPSGCWHDMRPAYDAVVSSKLSMLPVAELYGRHGVYAVKRRQFNSAEIARLGLKT